MKRFLIPVLAIIFTLPFTGSLGRAADTTASPYLTFGIFLGKIEEGARIFTPVRFLPPGHPEAGGHDFPTVQAFHTSEFESLLLVGEKGGLKLWATLERYPTEPVKEWAYSGFLPPPVDSLREARTITRLAADSHIPGLRVAAFVNHFPVAFIVDTRTLTLKARHMTRSTSMGLEITRKEFLDALTGIGSTLSSSGTIIIRFK
jgi:hypothetical protein